MTPGARGRGVGRALLEFAVAGAMTMQQESQSKTSLTLWVDEGNEAALALYSSAGFRRERAAGKEEEKSEGGEKDGSSSSGGISLLSSSSLAAAAMKLYHRALCRFFLGTSRWVRLAMPLLGGEVK